MHPNDVGPADGPDPQLPDGDTGSTCPPASAPALDDPRSGHERLGPNDHGRWLVTTVGSRHVWDMTAGTYQRLPGLSRALFLYDTTTVPIARVDQWPEVGSRFLIWFNDPDEPDRWEHWRLSSTVQRIERLPD